ncbi:MAG: hypothetical protein NW215_05205 [Hyphomicrobiales bacterium]|nr:hypothetical protein [Hyphomicrobiales bacterium]
MGFISPFPKKHHPLQEKAARFSEIYRSYLARGVPENGGRDAHITIIARSAFSPVCRMLCSLAGEFEERGVTAQVILAAPGPVEIMRHMFDAARRMNGRAAIAASFRWAQNPSLLDAHEQMTLGAASVWTGDCMRRSADNRNGLDLFEPDSLGSVRLADLAFSAMWMASRPLPPELLEAANASGDSMAGVDAVTIAEALCRVPPRSAEIVPLRAAG